MIGPHTGPIAMTRSLGREGTNKRPGGREKSENQKRPAEAQGWLRNEASTPQFSKSQENRHTAKACGQTIPKGIRNIKREDRAHSERYGGYTGTMPAPKSLAADGQRCNELGGITLVHHSQTRTIMGSNPMLRSESQRGPMGRRCHTHYG
jgi:hypothetical protein